MSSSDRIQVLLQPVGMVPADVLKLLEKMLSNQFSNSRFIIAPSIDLPSHAFDARRNQYVSPIILGWIQNKRKDATYNKVLGICNIDAYSGNLNFVFGEAQVGGRIASIYLPRLKQEFYGLDPDESLFLQRVVKEAIHELGHAFGLSHCKTPTCVMYFSNSLADTDNKSKEFCDRCKLDFVRSI